LSGRAVARRVAQAARMKFLICILALEGDAVFRYSCWFRRSEWVWGDRMIE
jgi:hypothetical protein